MSESTAQTSAPEAAQTASLTALPPQAPADTRDWLPEEYRGNPLFADFKDPNAVFKSYVNAATMIGADRAQLLKVPKDPADTKAWNDLYGHLGRPENPDGYELSTAAKDVDNEALTKFAGVMHEAGLSKAQAGRIMGFYNDLVASSQQAREQEYNQRASTVTQALRQEWGAAFDDHLHAAQRAVVEYGGDELAKFLGDTKLDNHPALLKTFAKMGMALAEPSSLKGGGGGGQQTLTPAAAQAEIRQLHGDREFFKVISDRQNPGYTDAKARWDRLHGLAYPGQPG